MPMKKSLAIIGTGYVGMRIGLKFAQSGFHVLAYDKDIKRVEDLKKGIDRRHDVKDFSQYNILFTSDIDSLLAVSSFIITVSTPLDKHLIPDLSSLKDAARTIGAVLKKDDLVVFESTVYPGATEEDLIPILEQQSNLKSGIDFYVAYSPERIVFGDAEYGLDKDIKVISAQNKKALGKIIKLYRYLSCELHCASSIRVAEASKLLENIQRDVNIALMNEYTQIMNKMDISMQDVLLTAKTKWNFAPYKPGLVGGHCIPMDPYYLIYQANKYKASSELITKARQVNEDLPHYICDSLIKLLSQQGLLTQDAKILLLGISFKPNVADTRHSLSIELYKMLEQYDIEILALDPLVDREKNILNWVDWKDIPQCHGLILIQEHDFFLKIGLKKLCSILKENAVFMDIPGVFADKKDHFENIIYWSL